MASLLPTLRFIGTHPLSSRKPFRALWRYASWQIESRLHHEIEFDWVEGAKLIARNGMTGATGNIYCGLHEFTDMAFVMHLLRSGDLFVDVGANIGSYTVLASAVCKARTVAIEPDPDTMRSLCRNVSANHLGDQITLVQAAVGARPGRAQFTVGNDTTNRIVGETDGNTREVQVRTLDDILDGHHPSLIKLDIEGHEAEAVAGARRVLDTPSLQAVLIETLEPGTRAQLETAGFREAFYDPFTRRIATDRRCSRFSGQNSLLIRDLEWCRKRVQQAAARNVLGEFI